MDQQAAVLLKTYLESYESPYAQNNRYIAILASTIDWQKVAKGKLAIYSRDLRRFRAIGTFLQHRELPAMLSWNAIEQAMPPLGGKNPVRIQDIRASLSLLGELLCERGEIEDWNQHLHDRAVERCLKKCPRSFRGYVSQFYRWRLDGMLSGEIAVSDLDVVLLSLTPRFLVETTGQIVRFFRFCGERGTNALADINPLLIHDYQENMLWRLQCSECHRDYPIVSRGLPRKCPNRQCGATDSYERKRRLTRSTLYGNVSAIRIFFDWAQHQELVPANPFATVCCGTIQSFTVRNHCGDMIEIADAIRRYDDSVVQKLCAYIVAPETDPEEALALYFVIFHLLTNRELRNLRIPSCVDGALVEDEDFKYLFLPVRNPTRGHRTMRRTDAKFVFPRKAFNWIKPILTRHYAKRTHSVNGRRHGYFFVSKDTARSDRPVSKEYMTRFVQDASIRAIGMAVNPSDLRRTVADMIAQGSKRRAALLTRMGYSSLTAVRFNYLPRFTIVPKSPPRLKTV